MDKDLIKKLSRAGVSSDVILALMLDEDEKQPEQKPEQASQPEQKPEPASQPEQKPEPTKKPVQPGAVGNDEILAAIEKLTGAVQAANIRNMGGSTPKQETADDVLAQIINPTGKEA